jgi:V/A-type H+-transporting ATPase subunit F
MDYKIAVIGDRESILGFQALGLEVHTAKPEDAAKVFHNLLLKKEKYAIIYITEELASLLSAEIDDLKDDLLPAVIPIPSKAGPLGLGMNALTRAVERAVGANILAD